MTFLDRVKNLYNTGKSSVARNVAPVVNTFNNRFDVTNPQVRNQIFQRTRQEVNPIKRQALTTLANGVNEFKQIPNQVTNFAVNSPKLNFVDRIAQNPVVKGAGWFGNVATQNTQKFGDIIGQATYAPFYAKQQAAQDDALNLQNNAIRAKALAQTDPVKRQKLLQIAGQNTNQFNLQRDLPASTLSNKQILATAGGTAFEALQGGNLARIPILSGGAQAASQLSKLGGVAPEVAAKLAQSSGKLKLAEVASNVVKNAITGGTQNALYAVSENRDAKKAFGQGAAFSGALTGAGEAVGAGLSRYVDLKKLKRSINSIKDPVQKAAALAEFNKSTQGGFMKLPQKETPDIVVRNYKNKVEVPDTINVKNYKAKETVKVMPDGTAMNVATGEAGYMTKQGTFIPHGASKKEVDARKKGMEYIYDKVKETGKMNGSKLVKKPPTQSYGALAGFETYQDENGNTKVRYNPTKGAIGLAGTTIGINASNKIAKAGTVDEVIKILGKKAEGLTDATLKVLAKTKDSQTVKNILAKEQKVNVTRGAGASEGDLNQIRKNVRRGGKVEKTTVKEFIANAETQMYNRFAPIERLEKGKNLKPSQSPSTLIKRTTGSDGIANAKLEFEVSPILKTVEKDLDNLDTLMVSQRMEELSTQGRSTSPGNAVAQLRSEIGDERFAKLEAAAEKLRQFQDKQLAEWKSVGGLSDEGYAAIKANNQKYTPFQRVMDDLEEAGFASSSMNSGQQPIKVLKGSDRAIESPLESIVSNTYRMQKATEKNRAMSALANLGEDAGITKAGKEAFNTIVIKGENGLAEYRKVLKPEVFQQGDVITVFQDGKKVAYKVPKDVADAVKGMDEEQLNLAVRAIALPAKVLRAGATGLNIGFAVPNLIRDQLSAAVNSKYGGIPIYDFVSGLASVVKKDDAYKKWLLSGADMASNVSQDRSTIRQSLKEVARNKIGMGKLIKDPLELARLVSEFSEKGSRVGVFKRAQKGATKSGLSGFDVQLDAMRQAREATVDFAQRGSKMKAANAIIPFLNARIQGAGKLLQSFKKRPVQTGLIGMATATIPAATLYAYNAQFPDFFEIADYERENNFIIMTGNKDVPYYKIPKGEIGRIFGNPAENFLGYLYKEDKKSFAEMSKDLLVGLSPIQGIGDVIPTAFSVPLQATANYDTFRKRNIVSPYQKDLPADLQFDKKTSETSKALGSILGLSPAKIDFVLKGYGAGVAKQSLQLSDTLLFNKAPVKTDLPVLDRFMGAQSDLNKTATKIYEEEDKRKQEQARTNYAVKQRIDEYLKTGNEDLLREAAEANPESFKQFFNDALENQAKEGMSPAEKAIQSLPKSQQDAVRSNIETLPTTETPGVNKAQASNAPDITKIENTTKSKAATDAEKALAKFKVTYGKESKVVAGDTVYIRDETKDDGYRTINLQTQKEKLEEDKRKQSIADAKDAGDLKTWISLKDEEIANIEVKKAKLDPEYEMYDIYKLEQDQQEIRDQIAKYQGYGGFKKGKKAKKAKKLSLGGVSGLDASLPKLSVGRLAVTRPSLSTKATAKIASPVSAIKRTKSAPNSGLRAVRGRKVKVIR